MTKTNMRSIKNIWKAGHCIQPKRHIRGCSGSEIVAKQIFNLDRKLYSIQKYVVCKPQVEIGHTFTKISLNLADFTDFFLNINVMSFSFHFLQGILSHPFCYLIKRALLKARKLRIFKFLSLRPTLNVPKSSPLQKVSEGVDDRFILTDLKTIYTRFGSSQFL